MSNPHSPNADGSFLGFLFQIERALLWLSEGSENGKIGIETNEDIVIQLKAGDSIEAIYEQAKHAQKTNIPFSDQSVDLWKTLYNWIVAVQNGIVEINSSRFSAITNKILPKTRLIVKLSNASLSQKDSLLLVKEELLTIAKKLPKSKQKYAKKILSCDPDLLNQIIDKITLSDGSFHHNQNAFKKKLKENLSVGDKLPFDYIYKTLIGHITDHIIECWKKKTEAWLEVQAFNNLYNDLIVRYRSKSFLEKATELLPINQNEIQSNKKGRYVEQLNIINCEEEEILEAIHDYLRAKSEKGRYAKEFEVPELRFIEYYDDLKKNWQTISRPKFKINANNLTREQMGYEVFYSTIQYKGKLNSQEPEQSYTYRGAYHHLANELEIGWHPDWEDKLKKKK